MKSSIEQIKEKLSIVDVVGAYVELHRAGKSYKGKSPFTSEKTPSFYVSPDRGMYYCFSSSQGGDMFTFIEAMEGVDFKGALKLLAEKAGVELVAENPEKKTVRDRAYGLLEDATVYFFVQGMASPSTQAYLASRGCTAETIHGWRIGLAPDAWRSLREHMLKKGYTDAELLAAGLVKQADGKEPYDVFRNRVMFPICDSSGRVVGFSGRTLSDDPKNPKYVNSPETELFKKSEVLFGYHFAKQGIRHYDFSLVVEGQFDVVLSHQVGYTNAVAVSGTAFTHQHIDLLSRLSPRAVLCFDADKAGIAATKRSAEPMLMRGMDVKVARIIGGKDPADIAREEPTQLKKIIGNATTVVVWLLEVLKEHAKDDRAYKLAVRDEVLPLIASIPDAIDREHFEGEVADAIATTREAVHAEVLRLVKERADAEKRGAAPHTREHTNAAPSAPRTPAPSSQLHDFFLFFYTFITILATEPKKQKMHDRTKEIVGIINEQLAAFDAVPPVPTEHEINEYIARRTREIKRDFEEAEREEHAKIQAMRIAHALTQFHQHVIKLHVAREHARLHEAEQAGADISEIQQIIGTLHKQKPYYAPEEFR